MDLLQLIKEINECKNEKEKLESVKKKISLEIEKEEQNKKIKLLLVIKKNKLKIQKKTRLLLENNNILKDTINEYWKKEKKYKFPLELIKMNETRTKTLNSNKNLLETIKNLEINKKKIIADLEKNYKLIFQREQYLIKLENKQSILNKNEKTILSNYKNEINKYIETTNLFEELCNNILIKNFNKEEKKLNEILKKENLEIKIIDSNITNLENKKAKLNRKNEILNLEFENLNLNIEFQKNTKQELRNAFNIRKNKLKKYFLSESKYIKNTIYFWKKNHNISKCKLKLSKIYMDKYRKYLENEIFYFRESIIDKKNKSIKNKNELEINNKTNSEINNQIFENKILLLELEKEINKTNHVSTTKYKYYMNFYTNNIKDIKIKSIVLNRDIKNLKKINLDETYCKNENNKINILKNLLDNISNE